MIGDAQFLKKQQHLNHIIPPRPNKKKPLDLFSKTEKKKKYFKSKQYIVFFFDH